MRKHFLITIFALIIINTFHAQTRGTKIGYIDMEYILQNVPNYLEAQNQLEQKAQKWKQEIEVKKNEIDKLKEALKAEKPLLTKGLIEERIAEITFLENETLEFQQKIFGPSGDLMNQKNALTKPIQDQVFTAIQDIAEAKKYDFIFDKTSDLTMLFAAKRYDISDQIIRVLNRAEKREQLSKKQLKEEEAKEAKQNAIDENPVLATRQKALEEKQIAREKAIADRLLLQEEKKKEAEDKRAQILADREAKKTGTSSATQKTAASNNNEAEKEAAKVAADEARQKQLDERAKGIEDRKQVIEEKKKAAEQRRAQILEEREAKKGGITTSKTTSPTSKIAVPSKTGIISEGKITDEKTAVIVKDSIKENTKSPAEITREEQIKKRAKILEDRKKLIEENKKALEEKRLKILQDREDAKKAKE
jgi:Skp family chaperone for outer membrane proteins